VHRTGRLTAGFAAPCRNRQHRRAGPLGQFRAQRRFCLLARAHRLRRRPDRPE